MAMNARERYLAAARRQPVDRIPTLFRCSKPLVRRLMQYFEIAPPSDEGRLAEAHALLRALGADFWASGSRIDAWATFFPRYRGPRPQPPLVEDGSYFFTIGIDAIKGRVDEYNFEYPVFRNPPLATAERPSDLPAGFMQQFLDRFAFDQMVNRQAAAGAGDSLGYRALADNLDHVICTGILNNFFMICCYLRGMEQFLTDLAWNRALAEYLISEVGAFCLAFSEAELASFGAHAQVYTAWDDVAGQNGLLFSPDLFRKYFLPLWRRLFAEAKRYNLVCSWHCCGSVHQVLPMMIDAGIDVFDVVQTSAKAMDLAEIHRRYADHVVLEGAIDVQKLLVSGTPADVRAEVARARDLWGERGGLILGPSHEMVPETPIENILAIYF